jgi:hypothetical protein
LPAKIQPAQLEFTLGLPKLSPHARRRGPRVSSVVAPELLPEAARAPEEIPAKERAAAPSSGLAQPKTRFPFFLAGITILTGGIAWGIFHLWPQGKVEQAISAALRALPHFELRASGRNPFSTISVGAESTPALADLNGDGLPDLISGARDGELRFFRNIGSAKAPSFASVVLNPFGLVPTDTSNSIAFADLDGDGDLDGVNAGTNGGLTAFENRGSATEPLFLLLPPEISPFAEVVLPERSYDWRLTFADYDGNGLADLVVGTRDGATFSFPSALPRRRPRFSGPPRSLPAGLREMLNGLAFGDLDADGDLDAVASLPEGGVRFFENRGTANRPKFFAAAPGALGLPEERAGAAPALADLDADGDLDCIVGGADGRIDWFENLRSAGRETPRPIQAEAN